MMTKNEINEKIKALEAQLFFLRMKDTWTYQDSQMERSLDGLIDKYKTMLQRAPKQPSIWQPQQNERRLFYEVYHYIYEEER